MSSIDALLPPISNPYYIVAPPYTRMSAGVRTLHVLARALRSRGYETYIVTSLKPRELPATHPAFNLPILDSRIVNLHFSEGRTPIVVYPETIHGNPLAAPDVVRYILNYPGHLGGPTSFDSTEQLIYYSEDLKGPNEEGFCLFIPISDPRIFKPPASGTIRKGVAVYAGKYRNYHRGEYFGVSGEFIEITRDRPDSQSLKQIIHILQTSEVLYCYENSAIALEAVLCGCPVVMFKNEHFKRQIAETELTTNGISFSADADSIDLARAGVKAYRENYIAKFDKFWQQLDKFIEISQSRASLVEYKNAIRLDRYPLSVLPKKTKMRLGIQALMVYCRSNGIWSTSKLMCRALISRYGRREFLQRLSNEVSFRWQNETGKVTVQARPNISRV